MKQIVIFSGTTEGRALSEALAARGIRHIVCVATDYGEEVMHDSAYAEVRVGRMSREEMRTFLAERASRVFDATHPYATEVTANIRAAAQEAGIPCVRVRREDRGRGESVDEAEQRRCGVADDESGGASEHERMNLRQEGSHGLSGENGSGTCGLIRMPDVISCANYLRETEGTILLTTGSKELAAFAGDPSLRERLVARVLPGEESIRLCREAGLSGRQIVAAQGPFSEEFNRAVIRDYKIRILVTKESGAAGGYAEKLVAARAEGVDVVTIARPTECGCTVEEALREIEAAREARQLQENADAQETGLLQENMATHGAGSAMRLDLVGAGPGDPSLLTQEARDAVEAAEILFGAARVLAPYAEAARSEKERNCAPDADARAVIGYRAEDIQPVLLERRPARAAILFSGDVSFYSGARTLLPKLRAELDAQGIRAEIRLHPGISSVSYLAAKCEVPYSDAAVCSLHGAGGEKGKVAEVMQKIKACEYAFVLLSGAADVRLLGAALIENGMEDCEIKLAEHLSYSEESIRALTPAACCEVEEEGLYLALIRMWKTQGAAHVCS